MRWPARAAVMLMLCAVIVSAARPVRAELTRYDVTPFRPTPGPRDLIIIPQSQPLAHLSVAIGSYFSFIFNPLVLVNASGNNITNAVANQLEWDLMVAVGLYDWVELGLVMPIVLFQQSGNLDTISSSGSVQSSALGDLTLVVKTPLIKRRSYSEGFGAALSLRVDLPTGSQAAFASDGAVDYTPSGILDYRFSNGILIGTQVGVFFRPALSFLPDLKIGPELLGAIGAEVPLIRSWGLTAVGGVSATIPVDPVATSFSQCNIDGLAGLRWYASFGVTFTVGAGLNCHISTNPFSIFLAAVWVPAATREYQAIEDFKKPPDDPDGDGIIGSKDLCPNEPGPLENNGCPISDLDKDGIPDNLDKCPLQPGPKQYNGCPRVHYHTGGNKIHVLEDVNFATDQDVILPESRAMLTEVAQLIKAHPEWWEILVGGHTDIRASDAYNLDLSQRRARSVMTYLLSQGVETSRLRAQGFGRSQPIAPNTTEEGMALNRRVEFTILRMAPPQQPVQGQQGPAIQVVPTR